MDKVYVKCPACEGHGSVNIPLNPGAIEICSICNGRRAVLGYPVQEKIDKRFYAACEAMKAWRIVSKGMSITDHLNYTYPANSAFIAVFAVRDADALLDALGKEFQSHQPAAIKSESESTNS